MYAQNYRGIAPIGWVPDNSDAMDDEQLFWGTANCDGQGHPFYDYVSLGLLFPANIISQNTGAVFYCPSNNQIPVYGYNVSDSLTLAYNLTSDGASTANWWPAVWPP